MPKLCHANAAGGKIEKHHVPERVSSPRKSNVLNEASEAKSEGWARLVIVIRVKLVLLRSVVEMSHTIGRASRLREGNNPLLWALH